MPALIAILAGGRGKRLGGGKPNASLAGRPLIEYPLSAALATGLPVCVFAKADTDLPPLEVPVVREPDLPQHPLSGVVAALDHAGGEAVVAVACDMPFVPAQLLAWLARLDADAAVPVTARGLHPMLALYGSHARARLSSALDEDARLQAAVQGLHPRQVTEAELRRFGHPERILCNVNTPNDLERAEALLGETA
jgi:molybdenum cofactor guanylyltransferase